MKRLFVMYYLYLAGYSQDQERIIRLLCASVVSVDPSHALLLLLPVSSPWCLPLSRYAGLWVLIISAIFSNIQRDLISVGIL